MRVVTFIFALMLVMGVSFGGASLVSTHTAAIAQSDEAAPEGEMPGGEMEDAAEENTEEADAPEAEDTAEGEIPGGEMEDEAAQ